MKKTLLLTIMCVFALLGNVKAQQTIEIGSDKNLVAGNYYLPTYDYSKYSISQQIYREEEFDGNFGAIKSVSFRLSNAQSTAVTREYEIYMKHTDREEMIGSYVTVDATDKVFDGFVEISGFMNEWVTIPFTSNFDYAGGDVMICVYDKTKNGTSSYHMFYTYATEERRAMYSQGANPYDVNNLTWGFPLYYINQVKFEMEAKPIVNVELDTIDLGEVMLGNYWSEKKPFEVNAKVVATTITDVKVDNDFFVVPAMEDIDFTTESVVIEVSYNKNATVDGEVNGNLTISYEDTELVIPMTANAYTPGTADVYELAKEITFTNNQYTDTPEFADLHDNYSLPKESVNAITPDAVYTFELERETILRAKLEGSNAKLAIYSEDFNGKGGPSNDNNDKGNVLITSEFFFDFNEDVLTGWTVKNNNDNVNNWEIAQNFGVDSTNCVISASYKTGATGTFLKADNYLTTEKTYYITENSKLSFDAKNNSQATWGIDHVRVEVSKDGENMIFIEEITPGDGVYETKVINLGAKFAELGLEYSDYHIVLHHKEDNKMNVMVDNVRLTGAAQTRGASHIEEIYAVEYPAGKYYLVAAAEGQFTLEIAVLNAEELPATPANVVATTIDEFSIELTWEAAERATSYNIYRNDEFVTNVTGTTYIDGNLDSDVDYCYVVRAYNDIMESAESEKACAKTKKVVLTPPTSITAEALGETSIQLTWAKVDKVGGYKIYYYEEVVDIVTDTTYTVENLTSGTEYCFNVASVYKNRESFDRSDWACATTAAVVPSAPANVKVEATSSMSVKVSWDEVENAKRYYIYSADTLVAKTSYTHYNIVGLEANTQYCYVVVSVNGEVESEKSEEACGVTLEEEIELVAPVVTATAISDTAIVLSWNVVEGATAYNVYADTALLVNVTDTTFTVTGLTANTQYCFAVAAVNSTDESEKSAVVCATTWVDAIGELASSFNIYPNPVNDKLYIETEVEVREVVVYDVYGRQQELSAISSQPSVIDVANLNSGVYFVKVRTENGEIVKRFIKK